MNELPDRRAAARADGDEERARGALARIALGGTNGNGSGDEGEINVTLTTSLVRRDICDWRSGEYWLVPQLPATGRGRG